MSARSITSQINKVFAGKRFPFSLKNQENSREFSLPNDWELFSRTF